MNASSAVSSNQTVLPVSPQWGYEMVLNAICSTLALFFNTVVVVVFSVRPELRTTFTIYLTALLTSDALMSIHGCLTIIKQLYPVYMRNVVLCDFRLYIAWVMIGVPLNIHVLITVNRIWAIAFPLSYRSYHSSRLALILVVVTIAYVHVIALPGVIMNALYFRRPLSSSSCSLNLGKMTTWYQMVQIVIYEFPVVFMIVAWMYLMYRQRKQQNTIHAITHAATIVDHSMETRSGKKPHRRKYTKGFLVFSVLTLSAFICWTPYETIYTLWAFFDIHEAANRRIIDVSLALYLVQPVLDPILIMITMDDLRATIKQMLRCK
ncbi:histamine H2 receptor-like [Paramacrobiotus metropolitanus]|uniref:histamine H2 receptor-like n=1 Tax=Paramacrobiotus metropolitanus TaxID=2943436 RepID=UPI002445701B|nr:histamine H2 receptor-like [Paramacrobiotus metropolitanus]